MAREIVLGVDFSECSFHAGEYAKELAKAFDARIVLVHAFRHVGDAIPQPGYGETPLGKAEAEIDLAEAMNLTEKWSEPLRAEGFDVAVEVEVGEPSKVIRHVARKRNPLQIVIGTHGKGAIEQFFVGSVTKALLKHAPCPVTVVPLKA